MTDRGLILGALLMSIGIVAAAWLFRPIAPVVVERIPISAEATHCAVSIDMVAARRKIAEQFIEQVMRKTLDLHHSQEITNATVQTMILSENGQRLEIVPRIEWTRQDTPTDYPCTLRADGFGGFVGKYSPMSDNRKEIYIDIRLDQGS